MKNEQLSKTIHIIRLVSVNPEYEELYRNLIDIYIVLSWHLDLFNKVGRFVQKPNNICIILALTFEQALIV